MTDGPQQQLFREWLGEHRGLLFKIVRAHASDLTDQDDLFQEIVTELWRSIPGYRRESAATTWIYRVALYTAMAWSRVERKHRDRTESIEVLGCVASPSRGESDARVEWLYAKLRTLPEVDRSLALLLLDGYSHMAIASLLGLSESNVGVRVHRLKQRLARSVDEV